MYYQILRACGNGLKYLDLFQKTHTLENLEFDYATATESVKKDPFCLSYLGEYLRISQRYMEFLSQCGTDFFGADLSRMFLKQTDEEVWENIRFVLCKHNETNQRTRDQAYAYICENYFSAYVLVLHHCHNTIQ